MFEDISDLELCAQVYKGLEELQKRKLVVLYSYTVAELVNELHIKITGLPKLEPIPDCGDLMTYDEWYKACDSGFFTDYDGHGRWATKDGISSVYICPSQYFYKKPNWATHVVWFNK